MLKSISPDILQRIETRLHYLYGDDAHTLVNRIHMMVGRYGVGVDGSRSSTPSVWDEKDIVLIAYGDMVRQPEESPLRTLGSFLNRRVGDAIRTIHILPFFPYSSDDGFSVKDYRAVDPALGTWKDVAELRNEYNLMFDLVINHVSRQSTWFRDYVNDIAPYRHFFHEVDPATDLSSVVRPRNLPLLTETQTRGGKRHVWTTFSSDQIDLNFANPEVLIEMLDILLWYISKGARIIRLDAIAYLWKVIGTPCIHLTQTHEIVKLFRDLVDMIAPDVLLLTETNVPHEENISYFGQGDEAHMVYQFSLPPLLAHGLLTGYAGHLTRWADSLPALNDHQTFFNFTASHDGLGVRPLQGLISEKEFTQLVHHVEQVGGRVSYKRNADGTESPYELNITYFDLFADDKDRISDRQIARYLSSQAIMLSMRGMPAVYFNSLFGARNNHRGVQETGAHRTINREKWGRKRLESMLDDPALHHQRVLQAYVHFLDVRRSHAAFHPNGAQEVLALGDAVFAIQRISPDGKEIITCVTNFTDQTTNVSLNGRAPGIAESSGLFDLIQGQPAEHAKGTLTLAPYQTVWLTVAPK